MEINNNGSKRDFSIEAAYKFAIKTIDKNLLFVVGLGLLYGLILYAIPSLTIIKLFINKVNLFQKYEIIPVALGILILYAVILPILNKISLQFYDNNWGCFRHRLMAVFTKPKKFLKAFTVTFIYLIPTVIIITFIIVYLSLILANLAQMKFHHPPVIPFSTIWGYSALLAVGIGLGLYFFITYFFSIIIALDTDCTILQAFERSAQLTKGIKLKLAGFFASILVSAIVYFSVIGALFMLILLLLTNLGVSSFYGFEQIPANIINLSGFMLITLACVSAYRQLVPSTTPAHKLCECDINFKNLFKKK